VHSVKENAEALVVATKETVLEINADKTKYMISQLTRWVSQNTTRLY
jgi:hypothetical protein